MGVETKEHCLGESLRAAAHGLRLGPGLRRKIWVKGADWVEDTERLMPLVEALPVPEPHSAVEAIAQAGTPAFLRTDGAQAAVRDWGTAHHIPDVLRWFSMVVSAAVAARFKGLLSQSGYTSVFRSLPVLAMSGILPWSDGLWHGVTSILGVRTRDTMDVLRHYRHVVRCGDEETLLAVDETVCSDAQWGAWASSFPDLLAEAAMPRQTHTTWEFANTGQNDCDDILSWLFRRD